MSDKLDELGARIERVALDPKEISAPLARLLRPILARLGVQPKVTIEKTQALVERLRMADGASAAADAPTARRAFLEAMAELEANLSSVERACVVNGQPMVAHGAWLRRVYEVLVRARRAIEEEDEGARRAVAAGEKVRLLPPLTVSASTEAKDHDAEVDPRALRLVSMELATVDRLLDAAQYERELLGRKRRLLEAARQMLLEAQAALPLDAEGVGQRLEHLAAQISRLDRLQAAGVAPDVALTHQLRQATARGERDRAYALLAAMQGSAASLGDEKLLGLTATAMKSIRGAASVTARGSLDRSAVELFGFDLEGVAKRTYADARRRYAIGHKAKDAVTRDRAQVAGSYFQDRGVDSLVAAAVAVDGCFELGGAMVPTRVEEQELVARAVRHPTPDLALLQANDIADLPDAVLEDPRTLVLDLAAGRLLARRYVAYEPRTTQRVVLRGEVRAYVLDGSGSMNGPRGRMRDALLVSELLTLRRRMLQHAKGVQVALFYRYFDEKAGPTTRIASAAQIDDAITEVLGTIHTGGTNIESALVATLADIAKARANDPDLARAQIVLVTDGQAPVDEARVTEVRETVGDIPIALSVIALGEQNEALRAIVARQRARGERAFYHHISDAALMRIATGHLDQGDAIHPPAVTFGRDGPRALQQQIGEIVEELATLGRSREVESLDAIEDAAKANAEAGLDASSISEGERARALALFRDRTALQRQFDRWFPQREARAAAPELDGVAEDPEVEAVRVLLATITEMIDVVGGTELSRQADAIEILERLMPDARISPAKYAAILADDGPALAGALASVRSAARRDPAGQRSSSP